MIFRMVVAILVGCVFMFATVRRANIIKTNRTADLAYMAPVSSEKSSLPEKVAYTQHLVPAVIVDFTQTVHSDNLSMSHGRYIGEKLRQSTYHVLFDPKQFVEDTLAQDEQAMYWVSEYLKESPDLAGVSGSMLVDKPAEILNRMAAIDFLEHAARVQATTESSEQALYTLMGMVTQSLPKDLTAKAKQVMVAEKHDMLVALTRLDPNLSFLAYTALDNPVQQKTLAPALLAGLADRGVPRSLLQAEFARYASCGQQDI